MSRPKVLITSPVIPQIAVDTLSLTCSVQLCSDYTRAAVLKDVAGVDALFWSTWEKLDLEILEKAGPQLKCVGIMSAGINNIDVDELKKRGIKAGNTSNVLDDSVANVAVLLALAASRRLQEARLAMQNNQWTKGVMWMLGQDIAGSTVGIVGLGNIGMAVLKRLKVFKVAKFIYCGNREKDEGKQQGASFVKMDTLAKESDFVIISCPLTPDTQKMINADFFAKMKSTAVFVNIARGEVVDQPALIKALREGKIFAAGLDVMTPEPLPTDNELYKLPNVVLLPHLGSATVGTRNDMAELTAKNILKGLNGEPMYTPIC